MSGEVERNFRAASCAERARGAATVHGDFQIAGRPKDCNGLSRSSQSERLRELSDFLAAHGELDGARLDYLQRNILKREIRHQIAERIHAQYDPCDCLARCLCFRHCKSHTISDLLSERFGLKSLR